MGLTQKNDGKVYDAGGGASVLAVRIPWLATSVDNNCFVADRAYRVTGITARATVAGSDTAAVTAVINKVASGTAIASGTALHQGTINLKTTANTNATALALSATTAACAIAAGDCIGMAFTGDLTAAVGVATVFLSPA